jgi:hypothetical protein
MLLAQEIIPNMMQINFSDKVVKVEAHKSKYYLI